MRVSDVESKFDGQQSAGKVWLYNRKKKKSSGEKEEMDPCVVVAKGDWKG